MENRWKLDDYSDEEMIKIPKEWVEDWYNHVCKMYDSDESLNESELKKLVSDIREVIIQSKVFDDKMNEKVLDLDVRQRDWSMRSGYPCKQIVSRDK